MLRKIISVMILTLFMFSTMGLAFANPSSDMAVVEKVVVVEKFFDGTEQTGPLVERISKLEKDIWGKEHKGSLVSRADKLYAYCRGNFDSMSSLLIKINATEWSLTHMITVQPAKARIDNLERVLNGNASTGPFDDRLTELLKLAYTNGKVVTKHVTIEKDSLLKIKIATPLNTHTSRPGDVVLFQVADDIYADGSLVIPKGAQGTGTVTKVERARNFGRDAQIQVSFDTIEAIDGTIIQTVLGEKAKEENKSMALAAGASVAGMVILGPIGIVGGAFVHGKEVDVPVGAQMYIQVKESVPLYGI